MHSFHRTRRACPTRRESREGGLRRYSNSFKKADSLISSSRLRKHPELQERSAHTFWKNSSRKARVAWWHAYRPWISIPRPYSSQISCFRNKTKCSRNSWRQGSFSFWRPYDAQLASFNRWPCLTQSASKVPLHSSQLWSQEEATFSWTLMKLITGGPPLNSQWWSKL